MLPPLPVRIPDTFGKQAVEVGQRAVAIDEKPKAFTIGLARPLTGPRFAAVDRSDRTRHSPAPARRNADSVPRRSRPCRYRQLAHRNRDRFSSSASPWRLKGRPRLSRRGAYLSPEVDHRGLPFGKVIVDVGDHVMARLLFVGLQNR